MPLRRRELQRPDLRLTEDYLLEPMSPRGEAWLKANANGRQWRNGALVLTGPPDVCWPGSLVVTATDAGLAVSGCGPVFGAMLQQVRDACSPELSLTRLAQRLGFTAREWRLMEADERMVPEPDHFWERAMQLVDEVERERERRADAAEFN